MIIQFVLAITAQLTIDPTDAFVQHNRILATNRNKLHRMTRDSGDGSNSGDLVNIDELSIRIARQRLEDGYKKQLLSRKPLKLDYRTSRRWIQMNWNPKTKEEFYDLVANGNLRTPYISKRPEEYYGERGEWISWDHYLLVTDEDDEHDGTYEQKMTKWG